ncbi:MAG: YqgE/AlgH family protein [Cytophagales bacterium]|nr:YqgE/AlgH family protein [Cytophagales bacterium]
MDFFHYRNKEYNHKKERCCYLSPTWQTPNFERTTILLTEHNEEGSVGFILNKPSDSRVSEVMDAIKEFDARIYIGGPVQQDTLHFIHRDLLEDAIDIGNGLFWGGDFVQLTSLIETHQTNVLRC